MLFCLHSDAHLLSLPCIFKPLYDSKTNSLHCYIKFSLNNCIQNYINIVFVLGGFCITCIDFFTKDILLFSENLLLNPDGMQIYKHCTLKLEWGFFCLSVQTYLFFFYLLSSRTTFKLTKSTTNHFWAYKLVFFAKDQSPFQGEIMATK